MIVGDGSDFDYDCVNHGDAVLDQDCIYYGQICSFSHFETG